MRNTNDQKPDADPAPDNADVVNNGSTDASSSTIVSNSTLSLLQQSNQAKLSKNQLKKMKKWERKMEVKKRRKQQEKDAKLAKAKAEGRDMEKEREEMMDRAATGEGKRRRQEKWDKKMAQATSSFQVCIDCSFEESMNAREINSLAQQLRYCYAMNRRSQKPCYLSAASLGGETLQHLQNVSGFGDWGGYGFTCTSSSIDVHYKSIMQSVVYLTSDSDNVLVSPENDKIYVIGGIVDRNRLKRAALGRAESLGVVTAKLPLDNYLQEMDSTKVLTVNHVCEILMKYKELQDWRKAFMAVLPDRKKAKFEPKDKDEQNDCS